MNDAGDDNGNGDSSGEISYLIELEGMISGSAELRYTYQCFDEEGSLLGLRGYGTVSVLTDSYVRNTCDGYGIDLDAAYLDGTSAVVIRILGNEDEVLAEQTLQDTNNGASFRLGTAPTVPSRGR